MESKPVYVVSDIHLGAVPAATERAFRRFLDHVARSASFLLINGDLFDFWFEYRHVILAEHYRVLAKLKDVAEAGVPMAFVGGNHDAWAGPFLRDEVGIALHQGPLEMTLGGRRTLVAHGDGVGRGDLKYRALKKMIRNPVTVGAFRTLHPDLGRRIALLASTTEHKADTGDQAARGRAAFIQAWALEQMREDPGIQLVLTGHAHLASVLEVEPGRFYVNSGDWLNTFDYVVLPPGGGPPQLRQWPADGASARG
ncbi:MAG TPA: UDP-2,3-diacylglucosamine diphosphatase [Longimicrobium sp.]|jgi:UDP-2,3-diacylglucosamine hydrolase|uniref:UDP-2,3-diacylglucosamine diphosphatase n=1 Tax=Longimicrobium sp. TaxID=2029185 RepID=UPI002EDA1B18